MGGVRDRRKEGKTEGGRREMREERQRQKIDGMIWKRETEREIE